ncbi:MAG: hypothetical protein JST00_10095 [Deltaproteobacteria bacterium]|nr:hypothetical protein [Deltaproteobacteria bacterium]
MLHPWQGLRRRAVTSLVAMPGVAMMAWAFFAEDRWYETHMMVRYCVEDPGALSRAHVVRVLVALAGAAVIAFANGAFVRRALTLGAIGRAALAVVLAFAVSDAVLRIVGRDRPSDADDPRRSKAPPPRSKTVKETSGRPITYAIDSEGRRARTPDDALDHAMPTIVLIGESVGFGYGLDFEETIQAGLARRTGLEVANLSVNALANDEALTRLRAKLPAYERPIAVVSFVVITWLERNVADYRPRLALASDGSLVEIPAASPFLRGSRLLPPIRSLFGYHHDDEAIELTRAILRETADVARARGAFPLFVLTECGGGRCLPTTNGRPYVASRLTEDQPFASIEVGLAPEQTLVGDPHPNASGATRYVDAIVTALRAAHVAP